MRLLRDRPAGRLVKVQKHGGRPPKQCNWTGLIATPTVLVWLPGLLAVRALDKVHVNDVELVALWVSRAVAVTVYVPCVVGVPLIWPALLEVSPAGRPLMVQTHGGKPPLQDSCRVLIVMPTLPDWLPGLLAVRLPLCEITAPVAGVAWATAANPPNDRTKAATDISTRRTFPPSESNPDQRDYAERRAPEQPPTTPTLRVVSCRSLALPSLTTDLGGSAWRHLFGLLRAFW